MWAKAMYVGKRTYKREKRVTDDGEVFPEVKGMQYLFYTADWFGANNEFIEGMGRTRFDFVEEKEDEIAKYEANLPEIGGFAQIQIKETWGNQPNNTCKFVKKE